MMLFLKLLLAHLIGDFLLQPDRWVKQKEEKKITAPALYLHTIVHGLLTLVLVGQKDFWLFTIIITSTHFFIDAGKLYLQKPHNKRMLFFIDQMLHISVILLVCYYHLSVPFMLQALLTERILIYSTAVVLLTIPASIVIKMLILKWTSHTETNEGESLQSAGTYIGLLERIFVFCFVITGHWEAVGFLITAKSVFRFGDLKESKDRKLTEYILIGTLLSFGIALLTGMLAQYLLSKTA